MRGRDNDGAGREFSAGGVVLGEAGRVLLVRVCNLQGKRVWTFPKGHVEAGETVREAALREVEEETGWRCRVVRNLMTVRYNFKREGRAISKRVRWYEMRSEEKIGKHDPAEIIAVRWASWPQAAALLRYPADQELLAWVRTPPKPARGAASRLP